MSSFNGKTSYGEAGRKLSLSLPAKIASAEAAVDGLFELLSRAGCPAALRRRAAVVTDELAANICSYAYPDGEGSFTFTAEVRDEQLFMEFTDRGTAFDPLSVPEPDTGGEPGIGGYGIFLVKKFTDEMVYERTGCENRLRLRMSLAESGSIDAKVINRKES